MKETTHKVEVWDGIGIIEVDNKLLDCEETNSVQIAASVAENGKCRNGHIITLVKVRPF